MSSEVTFDQLIAWVEDGRVGKVATAVLALDEAGRRAFAAPLRAFELFRAPLPVDEGPRAGDDEMSAYFRHHAQWERYQARVRDREDALRVAGAGCLPRAADIVSWLRSDRFLHEASEETITALARVLRAPGRPSIAAVAQGLAGKLRPAQVERQWAIISRLLAEAGLPVPASEATVLGWIREVGRRDLLDHLRTDPRTPAMVPHVFAIAGASAGLDEEWPAALARLGADGDLDRPALLSGCLLRLRAGARPSAVRLFVRLHELLAPSVVECAEERQEYLGMLSSPQVAVADLALRALRAVHDAGLLEVEAVVEAAYAILPRPEKKLVRAQLTWLTTALDRTPDPRLFEAVTVGLGNEAVDLAEQALHLAGKFLPLYGETGHAMLLSAAAGLDGDLRRQADALLAVDETPAATAGFGLPPVVPPEPMPEPISSLPELAAAVAAIIRDPDQPVLLERTLAGLVSLAHVDRPALAHTLRSHAPDYFESPYVSLIRAVVGGTWKAWQPRKWELKRAAPHWMLVERVNELGRQMCGDLPPALLATPATVDGHVDPARVLALLTAAESEGWQPGPVDLSQALLRLPREIDPELTTAAGELTTPAGRAFAGWLREGGLPDPAIVALAATNRPRNPPEPGSGGYLTGCRRTVAFTTGGHPDLTVPAGLLDQPAEGSYERAYGLHREAPMACWPMMLPSHREILAAHVQPLLAPAAEGNYSSQLDILPVLAGSDGPFGPAMALCLAYGLTAGRPAGRLATADAAVVLASAGALDGALVGRELAILHDAGQVVLKRVAAALTDVLRAGAAAEVWAVCRELVPAVLTSPAPGPGAPELLALAEAAASATGAHDDLPAVTATAAQGTRSRLVTEAKRLARTLSSTENDGD
ncbi:hypothetical protein ACQPZJ_21550 [Actinoplanes sp. CA-054009]